MKGMGLERRLGGREALTDTARDKGHYQRGQRGWGLGEPDREAGVGGGVGRASSASRNLPSASPSGLQGTRGSVTMVTGLGDMQEYQPFTPGLSSVNVLWARAPSAQVSTVGGPFCGVA